MTRRIGPAALSVLGLLLVASAAEAITFRTRQCISAARSARRGCVTQCTEDFRTTFASCFGPGSACAALCIQEQAACQSPFAEARVECTRTCNSDLRTALQGCPDQPDPVTCADTARMMAISCTAGCTILVAEDLQLCSTGFNDCIEACASQR